MSSFAPAPIAADISQPDPTKHVFYQLGMVLGVDDLNQEHAYLSNRGHMTARELAGYGTVTGLRVSYSIDARGPRVVVDAGIAVSPRGEFIRIGTAQCAYLDDWLLQNKDGVRSRQLASADPLSLYVMLCYRDCPTDDVPIPGEPCRSEDDAMQPSRLTDDFVLDLRWEAPKQAEELGVRGFVNWLHRVAPVAAGITLTLDQFEAELRADADAILAFRCGEMEIESPPSSPPSSPPQFIPLDIIAIPEGRECEYLRAAFRIWVTEIRPRVHPDMITGGSGCQGQVNVLSTAEEPCLLLAEVSLPVQPFGSVFVVDRSQAVEIKEECRPILPSLRLLHEYLTCGQSRALTETLAPGPVQPATTFGILARDGVSDDYARADHSHGTPALPLLDGDAQGPIAGNTVAGLLRQPIRYPEGVAQPADGQALMYVTDHWQPADLPKAEVQTPNVSVVAAGELNQDGKPVGKVVGGLFAEPILANSVTRFYTLEFAGFDPGKSYVLKGIVITNFDQPIHVIEGLNAASITADAIKKQFPGANIERVLGIIRRGLTVRISVAVQQQPGPEPFAFPGFYIEVTEILA